MLVAVGSAPLITVPQVGQLIELDFLQLQRLMIVGYAVVPNSSLRIDSSSTCLTSCLVLHFLAIHYLNSFLKVLRTQALNQMLSAQSYTLGFEYSVHCLCLHLIQETCCSFWRYLYQVHLMQQLSKTLENMVKRTVLD